jgi:outer membrane protein TolC
MMHSATGERGCLQERRATCGRLILILAVLSIGGCRAPYDSSVTSVDRHVESAGSLVETERSNGTPSVDVLQADEAVGPLHSGVLTLDTARNIAVQANPDVHAARARLEAARARIAEAQSLFLPTVAVTHSSVRTFHTPASRNRLNTLLQPAQPVPAEIETENLAATTLINAIRRPFLGLDDPAGDTNSFSEHSSALAASWIVFDGFVRDAQVLAAKDLHRAAKESLADIERLIIQAIDVAYYQVQLAKERLRISRADESFSREQFEETEKLRAAGRATQADVDNFRVRMLGAQASVTAAIGLRDTGRVILAELMGREDVVLGDDVLLSPLTEETDEDMTLPTAEPWVERALAQRPDLHQLQAALDSAVQKVRAAKGLYSPTVALSGSWGFDRSSNLRYTVDDQSSAGVLDVRWELYTGGARRAGVLLAESERAETAANLHRLRLAVQAEVRQAVIDLADAQERIRLQRENLETAHENRRMIQAAYVAGKETLTRLNQAQRDFIQADASLALARIRLRRAWSDLHAAAATYREP